jgi:hypothetical protein
MNPMDGQRFWACQDASLPASVLTHKAAVHEADAAKDDR